jgi:hypothetical protein
MPMPKIDLPKEPLRCLDEAIDRLRQVWGIRRTTKTVRNDIWQNRVEGVSYVGTRPMPTDTNIDRYAQSLIKPVSPRRQARLHRAEASPVQPLAEQQG